MDFALTPENTRMRHKLPKAGGPAFPNESGHSLARCVVTPAHDTIPVVHRGVLFQGVPHPSRPPAAGGRVGPLVHSGMPEGLKRYYGQKHLHSITCSCYRRLPLLGSARARSVFVKVLGEVRERYGFALVGYVVMPEHIHVLISKPAKGTPSTVMQVLKQRVSRELRRRGRRRASDAQLSLRFGEPDLLPQFWQRRFHDFNV
jgi:REP element-mobilizing transposase RayT